MGNGNRDLKSLFQEEFVVKQRREMGWWVSVYGDAVKEEHFFFSNGTWKMVEFL